MINKVEIKNFKSIKSKIFYLEKLNIMMGMNGQGKSSFIQSLLMLRQSKKITEKRLDLNDQSNQLCNLGSTNDILYQYASEEEGLEINLVFNKIYNLNLKTDYLSGADFFNIKDLDESDESLLHTLTFSEPLFNKKFQYLNAQRKEPKQFNEANYTSVLIDNNIGKYGEFTAHYIDSYASKPINFDNLIHPSSIECDENTGECLVKNTLIDQINFWLQEISPGVSVKTTKVSNEIVLLDYQFEQPNLGFTNKFKPENVGFGISYALHVVTAILKATPGDLIIIENPESHIHPKGQSSLGRLIALASLNDIQIVVETHSDHLVNGIRVAAKENNIIASNSKIFYFEKIIDKFEQFSRITDINIDKNGELSEYPENLLDEWNNQLMKLF